ncbi:MAG TPA: hypothetical protein PKJ45_06970 [Rubrivivax sp.]|nr:hypothetical protein [Rubrivivax sp.]
MKKLLGTLGLLLALGSPTAQAIDIEFDFTYDTSSFFSDTDRFKALDAAAAVFENRLTDNLDAITSSGVNAFDFRFFDPSDPFSGVPITLAGQSLPAGTLRVFVGSADLGASLGIGGHGGYSCNGIGTFCADASSRGQGIVSGPGATDFGPWGGFISFSSTATWHFGLDTNGLDSSKNDFYSVAVHELAHVLGFGTADSFENRVIGGSFVGPTVGSAALSGDGAHWAPGTMSIVNGAGSQVANMVPALLQGTRAEFTDLDYAAMRDIGWQVTAVPEAQTWLMLAAGLGVLTLIGRRRQI